MIQEFLKEKLEAELPLLKWTASHRVDNKEKATVYYEGGGRPNAFDVPTRYPNYMVYISSADWEYAEYAAHAVMDILHKYLGQYVTVDFKRNGGVIAQKTFRLYWLQAQGEPNDLGIDSLNIRSFSVNFSSIITELKEETNYAT